MVSLTIRNLSLEEIKELLGHVRRIEQRDPSRSIFCWIQGLETKTWQEAIKILSEIFPRVEIAG